MIALVLAGCNSSPPAPGDALKFKSQEYGLRGIISPEGSVIAFTVETPTADETVELIDVTPVEVEGAEIIEVRTVLISSAGGRGWRTHPNGECAPRRPREFGPARPLTVKREAKDYFGIVFYIRPTEPQWKVRGATVEYRDGDGKVRVQTSSRAAIDGTVGDTPCRPSGWFDDTVPVSPGRPAASEVDGDWRGPGAS